MPKMKTNKAASKRFRFTKSGKVKASRAFGNHILTKKTTKRKRKIRKGTILHHTDINSVRLLLPYGG